MDQFSDFPYVTLFRDVMSISTGPLLSWGYTMRRSKTRWCLENTGVNLAGIVGDTETDPEGLLRARIGVHWGSGDWARSSIKKKMNIFLEMARFGEFW